MIQTPWDFEHYSETTTRAVSFDHHASSVSPQYLADCCMDRAANEAAAEEATEFAYHWDAAIPAVYVVGERGAKTCKIGVSSNPLVRAQQLGWNGNGNIRIAALFWMVEGSAFALEAMSLALAKKVDRRKAGEWVEMRADTAAFTIASAALKVGALVADSSLHLRNMEALRVVDREVRDEIVLGLYGPQHLAMLRMNERLGIADP